jgi:hypothetical protein
MGAMIRHLAMLGCLLSLLSGCAYFPEISRQPQIHNPFPQLTRVAVAPFYNLSTEPTVDGRQFALAYFAELQTVPGFEVVPLGIVEQTIDAHRLQLNGAADVRKLAQILEVDAVVIGAVTDFSPYYPPRCGLRVEWYAANPYFHPIPAGYGLPWGSPEEEQIPAPLVFEAEMSLARAQMNTQTPTYCPPPIQRPANAGEELPVPENPEKSSHSAGQKITFEKTSEAASNSIKGGEIATTLPPDWPDPRGFSPPGPSPVRPIGIPTNEPVMRHTRLYNGNDADVTTALEGYVYFRDDARFGGWQSYLQRSDDFIRFCCHMHIAEMLTARGGAGETRVVWRWPTGR